MQKGQISHSLFIKQDAERSYILCSIYGFVKRLFELYARNWFYHVSVFLSFFQEASPCHLQWIAFISHLNGLVGGMLRGNFETKLSYALCYVRYALCSMLRLSYATSDLVRFSLYIYNRYYGACCNCFFCCRVTLLFHRKRDFCCYSHFWRRI